MNENLELLEYIYQTADMGVKSLTDLLNDIKDKDNKIKKNSRWKNKRLWKILKRSQNIIKKTWYKTKRKRYYGRYNV